MEITIKHEENLIIALDGRLDTVTSQELQAALDKEEVKENLVILDMEKLEYISSAGLRLLLSLKKRLNAENKKMEVWHLNNVCQEVIRVTGFNNILTIK